MKRFCAISLAVGLGLVGPLSAQLPNINTGSALQNRATVRVPGVDASNAARIRAGSNLDSSRLRLNANARNSGSIRADGVRISGQTNAAVETRRRSRNNRNADNDRDTRQAGQAQTRPNENSIFLQNSLEFRNRLAEIEHMRDIAIEHSDVQLMRRADQLEIALRARQRIPAQPMFQAQGQTREEAHAGIQGGQQFQGNLISGELQAGGRGNVRGQQRFQHDGQGRYQIDAEAPFREFPDAHGQLQQGSAVTADNSAQAGADTRARGEFATSATDGAINRFRQGAQAQRARAQGQAQQQSQQMLRTGGRVIGYGERRVDSGQRTARRTAYGTFRQGYDAVNNTEIRGEVNGAVSTTGRAQGGPIAGSVDQTTQGSGQVGDSRRRADPENNPAPRQGNVAPRDGAPTQDTTEPRNSAPAQDDPATRRPAPTQGSSAPQSTTPTGTTSE